VASSTLTTHAVVDVGDLQVLKQKCDRVADDLVLNTLSPGVFIADVKLLITAARIITTEHLPAATSAKEKA